MDAPIATKIREQLQAYLAGELMPSEFRAWFAPVLWDIDDCGDSSAASLAYDIELAFSEEASGAWTRDQLREELARLANQPEADELASRNVHVRDTGEVIVTTGTASRHSMKSPVTVGTLSLRLAG